MHKATWLIATTCMQYTYINHVGSYVLFKFYLTLHVCIPMHVYALTSTANSTSYIY